MGIWVGRYAIVDGEAQEHGTRLVERRRTRDDVPVRLVVLVEPVDERSTPFCHEIASAVAELFARESLSVTGGMLRALQQAHDNLAEWNRRSLREHRVAVGVTCVAVRGPEATIAQVGPGVVYIGSPGGVQRLVAEGEPARPLGGGEPVEPQFHRADMRAQLVLLLSRAGEEAAGPVGVASALRAGPERALADLFMRTRSARDMEAALIAEIDGVVDEAPSPLDGPGRMREAAGYAPEGAGTGRAPEPVPAPGVPVPGVPMLGGEETPAPVDSGYAIDAAGVDRGGDPGSGTRTGGRPAFGRRAHTMRVQDGPRRPAGGALPSLRRPRVAGGGRGGGGAEWRPWLIGGALAAVVALLLWFTVPGLLDEDREAQLNAAVSAAVEQLADAEQSTDAAQRRLLAEAALTELARARSVDAADPRIAALDARAQAVLAALDAITELRDPRVVLPFDGVITAPFDPAATVFGGGGLWLLDAGGGRVFAVDPAGADPNRDAVEVYRAGEVYDGAAAREPVGIAWDDVAQRLLIFDAARTLFEITQTVDGPTEPAVVPLRAAEDLRSVGDIAAYDGNLYLFDAEGGEVWRYLPAGGGFDSERSGLLGRAELLDGRRLYVDGDVYVLEAQAVRRFVRGAEVEGMLNGIDRPLEGAQAVVGDASGGVLYVADRGNRRVVVAERSGAFLRQYVHPDLFEVRGLALSPGGDFLYALTADAILEFALGTLPPREAPATGAGTATGADGATDAAGDAEGDAGGDSPDGGADTESETP